MYSTSPIDSNFVPHQRSSASLFCSAENPSQSTFSQHEISSDAVRDVTSVSFGACSFAIASTQIAFRLRADATPAGL